MLPLPATVSRHAGHAPAPSVVDGHDLLGEGRGDDAPDVRQLGIPSRRKLRVCCVGWGAVKEICGASAKRAAAQCAGTMSTHDDTRRTMTNIVEQTILKKIEKKRQMV